MDEIDWTSRSQRISRRSRVSQLLSSEWKLAPIAKDANTVQAIPGSIGVRIAPGAGDIVEAKSFR
jgi:hypothetical protein